MPPYEEKSFQENNRRYSYRVFSLGDEEEKPGALIGALGDVAKQKDTVWIRYESEWIKKEVGKDQRGRPLQRHPTLGRRRLYDTSWKTDRDRVPSQTRKIHLISLHLT